MKNHKCFLIKENNYQNNEKHFKTISFYTLGTLLAGSYLFNAATPLLTLIDSGQIRFWMHKLDTYILTLSYNHFVIFLSKILLLLKNSNNGSKPEEKATLSNSLINWTPLILFGSFNVGFPFAQPAK